MGRLRQGKRLLSDGLDWQSYFSVTSKNHHEILISCLFSQCPHQVNMKNVFKCWKDFLWYIFHDTRNIKKIIIKLFLIQDAAMSPNDDYSMPHWINLSFYSKNQRVGYSHFKSRINIPRRTEAQIRQNRQNAQIENIKHEDHVSNRWEIIYFKKSTKFSQLFI